MLFAYFVVVFGIELRFYYSNLPAKKHKNESFFLLLKYQQHFKPFIASGVSFADCMLNRIEVMRSLRLRFYVNNTQWIGFICGKILEYDKYFADTFCL